MAVDFTFPLKRLEKRFERLAAAEKNSRQTATDHDSAYAAAGKLLNQLIEAKIVDVMISQLWRKPEAIPASNKVRDRHELAWIGYWSLGKMAIVDVYPNDFTTEPLSSPRSSPHHKGLVYTVVNPMNPGVMIENDLEVIAWLLRRVETKASNVNSEPSTGMNDGTETFIPTDLQTLILKALDRTALGVERLADACNIDVSGLYKAGGLKELRQKGLVDHKHGVGCFRPDSPPKVAITLPQLSVNPTKQGESKAKATSTKAGKKRGKTR